MPGRKCCCGFQGGPTEMLLVENLLSPDQLRIELRKRHPRGQHGVLNIEEAVIPRLELARFREPALGSWVGSIDTDVHNLRDFYAPLLDRLESFLIPVRIDNYINRDGDANGAGKLQRFKDSPQRDALSMHPESFLIDRLNTQ